MCSISHQALLFTGQHDETLHGTFQREAYRNMRDEGRNSILASSIMDRLSRLLLLLQSNTNCQNVQTLTIRASTWIASSYLGPCVASSVPELPHTIHKGTLSEMRA